MKAILIIPDHDNQRVMVSSVDVEENGDSARLASLYEHVQCDYVQFAECHPDGPFNGHTFVVDENGLCVIREGFIWHPALSPDPLAGNILLMGSTEFGDVGAATIDEALVRTTLEGAYVTPELAVRLARVNEDRIMREFPDVIMVPASEMILGAMQD